MRKHISFAIAATMLGLAMVFCVIGSLAETNTNAARPKADLASSMPYHSRMREIFMSGFGPGIRGNQGY
jgi:hypothetical protein